MAQTWTAYYPSVLFTAGKNMGAILNAHAAEVLRIRRVGILNSQTAGVSGVVCQLELRRYTGASLVAPTVIVPVAHDTTNVLPASATYGYAGAPAGTSEILRRVVWSSDEPAIGTGSVDEIECFVPLNIIFDAGYGDTTVLAMALRQNQMITVWNVSGSVGLLDTWIEFTKE
jgi:hypothetical protein